MCLIACTDHLYRDENTFCFDHLDSPYTKPRIIWSSALNPVAAAAQALTFACLFNCRMTVGAGPLKVPMAPHAILILADQNHNPADTADEAITSALR